MPLIKKFEGKSGAQYQLAVEENRMQTGNRWYASFCRPEFRTNSGKIGVVLSAWYLHNDGRWYQSAISSRTSAYSQTEQEAMALLDRAIEPPPGFEDVVEKIINEEGLDVLQNISDQKIALLFGSQMTYNRHLKTIIHGPWGRVYRCL
jgi:hypothetical protein